MAITQEQFDLLMQGMTIVSTIRQSGCAEFVITEKIQRSLFAQTVPGTVIFAKCGNCSFPALLLSTFRVI